MCIAKLHKYDMLKEYSIHIQHTFHAYSTQIQHTFHAYSTHIPYTFNPHSIYTHSTQQIKQTSFLQEKAEDQQMCDKQQKVCQTCTRKTRWEDLQGVGGK